MSGELKVPGSSKRPKTSEALEVRDLDLNWTYGLRDVLFLAYMFVHPSRVVTMMLVSKEVKMAVQELDAFVVVRPLVTPRNGEGLLQACHHMNTQCRLTYLTLNNCNLNATGARVVSEMLRLLPRLLMLDLKHNHIRNNGSTWLGMALSHDTKLIRLSLEGNGITGLGARAIFFALCTNRTLEILDISDNLIMDMGHKDLVRMVSENRGLKFLNLFQCGIREVAGVQLARVLFKNIKLQTLLLGGNDLGSVAVARLARELVHNDTLTDLDLTDTNSDEPRYPVVTRALVRLLQSNTTLQTLALSESEFTENQQQRVLTAQKSPPTCTCTFE